MQATADLAAITCGLWLTLGLGGSGEVPATTYARIVAVVSLPCWLVVLAAYRLLSARHVQRATQELAT